MEYSFEQETLNRGLGIYCSVFLDKHVVMLQEGTTLAWYLFENERV